MGAWARPPMGCGRPMIVRLFLVGFLLLGCAAPPARALDRQDPPPAPAASTPQRPHASEPVPVDVSELPISVPRIQRQLSLPATLRLELARPMFRTEIIEKRPKWFADIEWIPETDARLPLPAGPAWHRDFLSMVTPATAMPFGQSTGLDLLQLMATSLVEGMTMKAAVQKMKSVAAARRASEARREVDDAIAAWKLERDAAAATPTPP